MFILHLLIIIQLLLTSKINSFDTTTIIDNFHDETTQMNFSDEHKSMSTDESVMMEEEEEDATTENSDFFDEDDTRILNKDFDRLGKIYVAQYYELFDDPKKRLSLVALYHPEDSFLTFEGERFRGTRNILMKYEKLNLKTLQRSAISNDTQPTTDGGIVINVIGKVNENDKQDHLYAQTFVYKPHKGSFLLQHDIFRVIRSQNNVIRLDVKRP